MVCGGGMGEGVGGGGAAASMTKVERCRKLLAFRFSFLFFYSTLATLALVTCSFSTRLISAPFEQKGEVERRQVGEN